MKTLQLKRQFWKISLILWLLGVKIYAQKEKIDSTISNPNLFFQTNSQYKLPIDKISIKGSYPLAVSDVKTLHVIFPAKIREVDTGTPNILVQITESFDNVLRIKSINLPEKQETNLTVLTEDGGLYSFLASYEKNPEILNINIGSNAKMDTQLSNKMGINTFAKSNWIEEPIHQSLVEIEQNSNFILDRKNFIKNVGMKSQGMIAQLRAIYNAQSIQYFKLDLENNSEIPFQIDFIKLYIKDIQKLNKSAIQQEELKIVKIQPLENEIPTKSKRTIVISTLMKSIPSDKIVEIEIYEKEEGRHLRFQIDSLILSKSKEL
ncbi:MAG: conjugative transposon protein TraN [Bacteroidota bacterium]